MPLAFDPYSYTSGRWLNHDKLERDSRYIQFDFAALCKKAVELCPGAGRVIGYEKKEGGFHRPFVIIMDDGSRVGARLPTSIADPRRLTTNFEVATMTYSKLEFPHRLEISCSCSFSFAMTSKVAHHTPRAYNPRLERWRLKSYRHRAHYYGTYHERLATWEIVENECTSAYAMHQSTIDDDQTDVVNHVSKLWNLYFSDAPIDPHLKSEFTNGFCLGLHCKATY